MMIRIMLLTLMFMVSGFSAYAEEAAQDKPAEPESKSAARAWLELQSSGQAASKQPQPISGKAMDKIHERYIKSFGQDIPEYYEHETPATR